MPYIFFFLLISLQFYYYYSQVDDFMYQHQDFLILVAAGNDGDEGFGTVGSPATAKNCVAVGASQSSDGKTIFLFLLLLVSS